jgi:exonuclease III
MKFISVNIETNLHTDTVLPFLKKENPDVVCFQELLEEEVAFYEKELNLKAVFQPTLYIHHPIYERIRGKKAGVAIFSNNIMKSGSVFYYGSKENQERPFEEYVLEEKTRKNYAFVWANIKNEDGQEYKIITTHLPVTKEGESSKFQLEVAEAMLSKLAELKDEFVLCGDMNAPRGNETFSRLAAKYKDNIPLEYKTSIDQNLHRVKGIQFMVDCLFSTPNYEASNVKLVDGVSDHMAIVANIAKLTL